MDNIFRSLRGYSLTGKTAILHIVILGSSPNVSKSKRQITHLNIGLNLNNSITSNIPNLTYINLKKAKNRINICRIFKIFTTGDFL